MERFVDRELFRIPMYRYRRLKYSVIVNEARRLLESDMQRMRERNG